MVSQPVPALGLPSWYILQEVLSRVDADPTSAAVVVRAHDERIKDPRRAAVAIKCIPRSCVARGAKYIEREVLHHRRLWHRHVVMFRELLLTDSHLCIVMDYIGGGTLHQLVLEKRRLSEGLARWFFQQLILAVDYCHQKGVMNRDVKLENIVVDDRQKHHPVVYVCDFGLSKHVNNSDPTTLLGTGKYMAPEVIYQGAKGLRYDGKKADIYSCGVCLAVMLFGYYPEVLVGGQPVTSDNDARQTGMRVKALVGAGEACLQVVLPQQRDADGE
ncbi:unnamed protein product [Ostreobium quekettii]|uniref:Protein kinase domain-containing protein n=1 Tax=Ostreobium quekettii TaxID=121088 RepID=A0A8S1J9A8_9CHLO|nr:unnamed protein product [Ostreobium quekettii]